MPEEELTGEDRCWLCTVANLLAGGSIGLLPLALVWGEASTVQLWIAATWALVAVGFTLYRIVERGYLPGAGALARRTGLHERVGPGSQGARTSEDDDSGG